MIQRLRHRDEQGSALLVALAFLSLFGVFIAAILSQVSTNMRLTGTTRARADRLMAADGGLEYGVQKARAEDSACPGSDPDAHELTSTLHIDGRDITVYCRALAGATASPASQQWSVITTAGLVTTPGAAPRISGGDVWAGGSLNVTPGSPIATTNADVIRGQATCAGYTLTGLTVADPDTSSCTTAGTPDVPHVLPAAPTVVRDPSTPTTCASTGAAWRIWHPGIYNAAAGPDIGPNVYMESGVYYFEDTSFGITSSTVIGGAPLGETSVLGAGCPTINDTTAGAASRASGKGVTIVLGGTARVSVTSTAKVELYSRVPATADGTPGISIITVPTTGSGYRAWSAPALTSLTSSPITGRTAIHGLVYSPNAPVTITTGLTAPLLGGVVASTLTIVPGAPGRLAVQASGRRTLILTSIAAPATADEIAAVQSAVVKIANDPSRTASVRSWRAQ